VTSFLCTEVHGSKKNISYSGELCHQNCIVKTYETLIVWSRFCYTAGCNNSDATEGCQTDCERVV